MIIKNVLSQKLKNKENYMSKSRKKIYKKGDIIAIPLESNDFNLNFSLGYYAYAKIYHDGVLGIYKKITQGIVESIYDITETPIVFHYFTPDDSIQSREWPIIGVHEFQNLTASIAPPRATCYRPRQKEWSMGEPKISYNGEIYSATAEQVNGMDIESLPDNDFLKFIIIERLVRNNNELYKVTL
jgi:Immunity protein 26